MICTQRLLQAVVGLALVLGATGGCATPDRSGNSDPLAAYQRSGQSDAGGQSAAHDDEASRAATLLAQAESAGDGDERDRLVVRLDAMGVHPADVGDDDPLAQWRAARQPAIGGELPWRGRALGPAYRRARVAPGESLVIEQIFLAGQRARIAAQISGVGGTDGLVALAISNPRAEAVCTRQLSPAASCNWLPIYTERFSIALQNRGRHPASIYLVVR